MVSSTWRFYKEWPLYQMYKYKWPYIQRLDDYSNHRNSYRPSADYDESINSFNDDRAEKNLKSKDSDSDLVSDGLPEKSKSFHALGSKNLLNEGILAWQRIAKISVITLVSIGIAEILIGYYSGSVVATADRHFGYHKVESFGALMAAIGIVAIGVVIFYNSYQALLHPCSCFYQTSPAVNGFRLQNHITLIRKERVTSLKVRNTSTQL